jgi:putative transposase
LRQAEAGTPVADFCRGAGVPEETSFALPPEVRRIIYTTQVIESLHMQLRKILNTRGHFPNDDAATKQLSLALRNVMSQSIRSTRERKIAVNQFAILNVERFTGSRS